MAGQFQYQPITGPVWREPVAERMAWQPRGQQPARALPPNRLGDYAPPVFAALYRPDGLQWLASDRYAGQPRRYALTRSVVLDPIPPVDPRQLSWQPQDRYAGQSLTRARFDTSVYPRPIVAVAFDPQTLDWMPRGTVPRVLVERRVLGDFQQPPFPSLFRSEGLQWQSSDRYAGRARAYSLQSRWIIDPAPVVPPPYNPQGLQWLSSGSLQPYRSIRAIRTGQCVLDPALPPAGLLDTDVIVPYLIEDVLSAALMRIASIYCVANVIGTTGSVTIQDPVAFTRVPRGTTITITLGGTIKGSGSRKAQAPYGAPDTAPPFPDPKLQRRH